MSKEWQEATNERAIEQKLNPISGMFLETFPLIPAYPGFAYRALNRLLPRLSVSLLTSLPIFGGCNDSNQPLLPGITSEGYSGKGFVQSK